MYIFNTSKFAKVRWLYEVIVTSYEVQWYSFWCQWIEEVHIYTLVANIGVSSIPYRKSREGVATIPLRRTCYKKYLRKTRVKWSVEWQWSCVFIISKRRLLVLFVILTRLLCIIIGLQFKCFVKQAQMVYWVHTSVIDGGWDGHSWFILKSHKNKLLDLGTDIIIGVYDL